MNKDGTIGPEINKRRDVLDDLIDNDCADELGLLDFALIEEILNQSKCEKKG